MGSQFQHPAAGSFQPAEIWRQALSELALQMPSPTYETWVRDTTVLAYEDGEFIVGAPHAYARDWLQHRLRGTIKRILSRLMQRTVDVRFRVRPRTLPDPENSPPPLLKGLNHDAETRVVASPALRLLREGQQDPGDISVAQRPGGGEPGPSPDAFPAPQPERVPAPKVHLFARGGAEPEGESDGVEAETRSSAWQPSRLEVAGSPLNAHYTFDTFVVGSHNRLAHAAALAVSDHPGQRFNPLFVYGGVGLGKTHLLHAIGHEMLRRNMVVLYCTSEQFTNDLISAIRNQSTDEFRNKYREVDLLLVDDIQFIAGKERTQEEFFHTFNHLHAAGRQVVISSDRPPKNIATLEARLRSRFEGGLQADISQPDLETRVAILQSKAAAMGTHVDQDVLMLVAERVESNIRELEGALNRLIMQARLYNVQLDVSMAEMILGDLMPQRRPREAASVVAIVAEHFGLLPEDLCGRSRTKEIAGARQIAMYLLREENNLSLPVIGELLGGRDHSTVRYGVEKIMADLETDEALRRHVMALREKVYAPPGAL